MILTEETMVIKIGMLGMAEEAVVTIPLTWDTDLSQEANTELMLVALENGGLELQEQLMKPVAKYFQSKFDFSDEETAEIEAEVRAEVERQNEERRSGRDTPEA